MKIYRVCLLVCLMLNVNLTLAHAYSTGCDSTHTVSVVGNAYDESQNKMINGKNFVVTVKSKDSFGATLTIKPSVYGNTTFYIEPEMEGGFGREDCNGHSADGKYSIHYHRPDGYVHANQKLELWIKDAPEWYNPPNNVFDVYTNPNHQSTAQ